MSKNKNKKKKPKGNPAKKMWTPFERVTQLQFNQASHDLDPIEYKKHIEDFIRSGQSEQWINSLYVVTKKYLKLDKDPNDAMQLSIRTLDRKPVRDWRHFQRIKNRFAGYEREAYEVYPAESQLMDEANQYHLWVMPLGVELPFAYRRGRTVMSESEAKEIGAGQRDFEPEDIPETEVWQAEKKATALSKPKKSVTKPKTTKPKTTKTGADNE